MRRSTSRTWRAEGDGLDVQALCFSHDVFAATNGHTILIVQQQKTVQLTAPPGPGQFTIFGDALVDFDENLNPVDVVRVRLARTRTSPHRGSRPRSGYDWTHCQRRPARVRRQPVLSSATRTGWMKLDYRGGTGSGAILWKLGYQGDFSSSDTTRRQGTEGPSSRSTTRTCSPRRQPDHESFGFDNGDDHCYALPEAAPRRAPAPPPPFSRGVIFPGRRGRADRASSRGSTR